MKLESLIITSLIVMGVMIGMGNFYIGMVTKYNVPSTNYTALGNFTEFNEFGEIQNKSATLQNKILNIGKGGLPSWISAIVDVGVIILTTVDILFSMANIALRPISLGVKMIGTATPIWFIPMMSCIVVVIVIFTVMRLIRRGD